MSLPDTLKRLLIPLLLFHLLTFKSAAAQSPNCPEPHRKLLEEYKKFHNENKYSSDAKYLVQACWGSVCQGTGDRLRGTMWLLRLAITHRRILLLDWTNPAPVTNFLLPSEIDWTFSGLDDKMFHNDNTLNMDVFNQAVYDGKPEAVQQLAEAKSFVITTNQHFYINTMWNVTPVDYDRKVEAGSCYFHFLFKLHQAIVDRGEAHLRQLYGPTPGPYVAWHWRHFDADGIQEQPVKLSHLEQVLQCAESLGSGAGIDIAQRPVLLITDFNVMRHFVQSGVLRSVVTPNITARHLDVSVRPHGVDPTLLEQLDIFRDVFVDLYLLSRSRCLLTSRSGFSKAALWIGGDGGTGPLLRCHRDMLKCQEEIVWRRRRGG